MLDKAPALDIELRMKEGKLVGTATMYELENEEDGPYVMLHGVNSAHPVSRRTNCIIKETKRQARSGEQLRALQFRKDLRVPCSSTPPSNIFAK